MAGGSSEGSEITLEHTPTWIIAVVCTVIVTISLIFERFLHYLGKELKRKNQKPLFEALLKVKEELMLLGFISFLLTVFQGAIQRICIPESVTRHGLPCKRDSSGVVKFALSSRKTPLHLMSGMRSLLASGSGTNKCTQDGKVPLLSLEAIHQLHIFIFVLALTHVILSAITVVLGIAQMRKWSHWEKTIQREDDTKLKMFTHVHQTKFIQDRYKGLGKAASIIRWLHSFGKQFYGSITKDDYRTMRFGFIMEHCRTNLKFNFYSYMIRSLEADFKKVVGISWYLWIFVIIFLLLNVAGWHAYFWISLIPFILLFVLGAKLEHIITELAHRVAERHTTIEGPLVVTVSDELFWFHSPKLVLILIHFILFQNAFEISIFFWILTTFGFNSCIVGPVAYIIPRLVISVIVQVLCGYSTLPIYAIVSQMGSSFKEVIFAEYIQDTLKFWAEDAKNNPLGGKKKNLKTTTKGENNGKELKEIPTESEIELVEDTPKTIEGISSTTK